MFNIFRKLIITVMMLTLSSLAAAETTDDSPVDNKSTYHISDSIDMISASDVQYEKPRIVIKMMFPRLGNSNDSDQSSEVSNTENSNTSTDTRDNTSIKIDSFNQLVTKVINEEINGFKQRVTDAQSYQQTIDKTKIKNRLTIDYSSAVINLEENPLISIRFVIQGYVTGMKQPFRRYRVVNFDLDAGNEIQLADLFKSDVNYLEVITNYATKELDKIMHSKPGNNPALTAESFSNWNFNLNGIRITFDEATVAPAALGSQSILIPYSTLKGLINPDSVLGLCLKNRSRCMRDHLLTGGFIDEAANTRYSVLNPVLG